MCAAESGGVLLRRDPDIGDSRSGDDGRLSLAIRDADAGEQGRGREMEPGEGTVQIADAERCELPGKDGRGGRKGRVARASGIGSGELVS